MIEPSVDVFNIVLHACYSVIVQPSSCIYPSCSALSLCEQPLFVFSVIISHSSFPSHTQVSYWFGPSPFGYYDLCWLLCVQHCFVQWLLLSEHTAQTSPGTTRFFLSIHLPYLSRMIPCSYWALTWIAALPSCITLYEISVRQTRDLPVVSLFPHPASFRFHLTMDTLAFGYILPTTGRIRDFNPLETCAARRTRKTEPAQTPIPSSPGTI